LISAGDVVGAVEMLGRYYALQGEVVLGDQRGRQLGTPTANLQVSPQKLLPAHGVYATLTRVPSAQGGRIYPSVTNLGVRPTVDGLHQRLETHLLDFPVAGQTDNLYGYTLTVEFVARLRDEQRFSGLEALKAQIQADIAAARMILQPILTTMLV
jgi:riboflavin kinase/FMN adenylyltransferase